MVKISNHEENKSESSGMLDFLRLLFVGILIVVFLVRSWFYASVYLREQPLYFGEIQHQIFILVYLIIASFYLTSAIGYALQKRFGYYLAWFLIAVDMLFSVGYLFYPQTALVGIGLTILTLFLIWNTEKHFKPKNKTDTRVLTGAVLLIALYLVVVIWGTTQPKPEEYQNMVTKEAIEKNDVKICDKLPTNRVYCISDFARAKKDPKICELIDWENEMDRCYLHVAIELKNSSLCSNIKSEYDRRMCNGSTQI